MYPKCPELTVIPAHLWGRLPYAFALVLSIDILTNAYMILRKQQAAGFFKNNHPQGINRQQNR